MLLQSHGQFFIYTHKTHFEQEEERFLPADHLRFFSDFNYRVIRTTSPSTFPVSSRLAPAFPSL